MAGNEDMRSRLRDFKETIFVDDYVEIKNLLRQARVLDPNTIYSEFIPKL
jgi:hypothetical protein